MIQACCLCELGTFWSIKYLDTFFVRFSVNLMRSPAFLFSTYSCTSAGIQMSWENRDHESVALMSPAFSGLTRPIHSVSFKYIPCSGISNKRWSSVWLVACFSFLESTTKWYSLFSIQLLPILSCHWLFFCCHWSKIDSICCSFKIIPVFENALSKKE